MMSDANRIVCTFKEKKKGEKERIKIRSRESVKVGSTMAGPSVEEWGFLPPCSQILI